MIYRTILSKEQVKEVSDALLIQKLKDRAAKMCENEFICRRETAYLVFDPEYYNGKNVMHRNVLDAAVRLLNINGVHFDWALKRELEAA